MKFQTLQDDFHLHIGPRVTFKKSYFQGFVVHITSKEELQEKMEKIQQHRHFQGATQMPFAYRLSVEYSNEEKEDTSDNRKSASVLEGQEDGREIGAGEKLLYLLRRLEIENLLLLVTREDRSLSGQLIGSERYKYLTEAAKVVLEKTYAYYASSSSSSSSSMLNQEPQPHSDSLDFVSSPGSAPAMKLVSPSVFKAPFPHVIPFQTGQKQGRINHFQFQDQNHKNPLLCDAQEQKVRVSQVVPKPNPSTKTPGQLPKTKIKIKIDSHDLQPHDDDNPLSNSQMMNNHSQDHQVLATITATMMEERTGIVMEDLAQLLTLRQPSQECHLVLICLAFLLSQAHDLTWTGLCDMMRPLDLFCQSLLSIDVTKTVSKKHMKAVRRILQTQDFTPEHVQLKSKVGAQLLMVVIQVIQKYDAAILGLDNDPSPSYHHRIATPPPVTRTKTNHPRGVPVALRTGKKMSTTTTKKKKGKNKPLGSEKTKNNTVQESKGSILEKGKTSNDEKKSDDGDDGEEHADYVTVANIVVPKIVDRGRLLL